MRCERQALDLGFRAVAWLTAVSSEYQDWRAFTSHTAMPAADEAAATAMRLILLL
jgi:hypothetical protein